MQSCFALEFVNHEQLINFLNALLIWLSQEPRPATCARKLACTRFLPPASPPHPHFFFFLHLAYTQFAEDIYLTIFISVYGICTHTAVEEVGSLLANLGFSAARAASRMYGYLVLQAKFLQKDNPSVIGSGNIRVKNLVREVSDTPPNGGLRKRARRLNSFD